MNGVSRTSTVLTTNSAGSREVVDDLVSHVRALTQTWQARPAVGAVGTMTRVEPATNRIDPTEAWVVLCDAHRHAAEVRGLADARAHEILAAAERESGEMAFCRRALRQAPRG